MKIILMDLKCQECRKKFTTCTTLAVGNIIGAQHNISGKGNMTLDLTLDTVLGNKDVEYHLIGSANSYSEITPLRSVINQVLAMEYSRLLEVVTGHSVQALLGIVNSLIWGIFS